MHVEGRGGSQYLSTQQLRHRYEHILAFHGSIHERPHERVVSVSNAHAYQQLCSIGSVYGIGNSELRRGEVCELVRVIVHLTLRCMVEATGGQ